MYGFKKGAGKAERKSFANGGAVDDGAKATAAARGFGMVRGPGTGTSDDVKDAVPPGTYIMPADSTQEIGPEALGAAGFRPGSKPKAPNIPGMGFGASAQVPVNLSNGEFRLSPEQVHAIGVQVLEGMKAATHAPAGEQGGSEGDDASTRELFFADGGLVDDPNKKRPLATSPTNTYPGNQAERAGNIYAQSNADLARGFGDAFAGTITGTRGAGQAVQDAYRTGGVGAAIGQGVRGSMVPAVGFLDDVARSAARTLDVPAQALKTLATGDASPIGQAQAQPAGQPQAVGAPVAQTPAATTKAGQVAAGNPSGAGNAAQAAGQTAMPPNSGPVPYTVTPVENTNGVQRINQKGQSPLFTNIDPGQAVAEMKGNPVGGFRPGAARGDAAGAAGTGQGMGFGPGSAASNPDVLGILQRESDIRAGMGAIQDRINFNGGNGVGFRQTEQGERGFTTIRDGAQAERDRAAVMDAALKPLAGARNGQLTANQLRTAQGMVEADQRNEQSRYQTDANAATQLETTGMREAGANNRANASNQIQQGELDLRKEAQGFQSRAARRQEDLQARYEAAKTPEERNAIAQQIRDLGGKEFPNRFTVVPGGQAFNPDGTPYTLPARVLNNQTGAFVDQPQAAEQVAVKAGEVRKGYRFKGGNPADQASWEKV